jgi:Spy/CpxP family protein refolding chaperone
MGNNKKIARAQMATVVAGDPDAFRKNYRPDFQTIHPAAIKLDLIQCRHDHGAPNQRRNMKNHSNLVLSALCIGLFAVLPSSSFAQKGAAMSKAQAVAQQLNLTPQQKEKVLPILISEGPKVQAIKNDNSLSKIQKIQQIRAIHQQTDPQMKAILTPEQYQKLKAIRQQAIREATESRLGH